MPAQKNPDAERNNPCLKEQEASYNCLSRNGYNADKCEQYFDNYNTCKKFWGKVSQDRRSKGLAPYLPEVSEREKVKEDYLKKVYFN
ncbi:unnamed protein product [Leptosia nina]|uniref:Coiled-coil-helix-coiled-coil-helix domain-containing protein 7 n=1 Tax=Leptosia nina TaxID=320188 RepID=A0AAV1J1J9_9NEOP